MSRIFVSITLPNGTSLSFHDDGSYLRDDLEQQRIISEAIDRRGGRASVPRAYRVGREIQAVA